MTPSERDIARVMAETGMARLQAIRHLQQRRELIRQAAPMGSRLRVSSDSAWPLRRADGSRWSDPR